MATENEPVETVERIVIEPAEGDDDETVDGADSQEDAPAEGGDNEGGDHQPKEQLVRRQPKPAPETKEGQDNKIDPAPVDGETPRERALRLEIENLRGQNRKKQTDELLGNPQAPAATKKELSPEKTAVLSRYKPGEIEALREVLPVLAEEMGYVRGDQLKQNQYTDKASEELDSFLKEHPEYLPENDKDNVLWKRFGEEYGLYRQPANPKDFRKIFNRIHKDIFGIKVTGEGKGEVEAGKRKVAAAAHSGSSAASTRTASNARPKANTSGLRADMLKGFTDEEKAEILGE